MWRRTCLSTHCSKNVVRRGPDHLQMWSERSDLNMIRVYSHSYEQARIYLHLSVMYSSYFCLLAFCYWISLKDGQFCVNSCREERSQQTDLTEANTSGFLRPCIMIFLPLVDSVCVYMGAIDQVRMNEAPSEKGSRRSVEAVWPGDGTDETLLSISERIMFIKITTRSSSAFR